MSEDKNKRKKSRMEQSIKKYKKIKKTSKNNRFKKIVLNIFLIAFILGIAISTYEIVDWFKNNKKNSEVINSINNVVKITREDNIIKYDVDFDELKKINPNTIGWLKVNGTDVEYPVVQAEDNYFYLNHSFNKEYNPAGWIFADCANNFEDNNDKNTVIYGHNRRDGSMFCTLKDVLNKEWYEKEENRKIIFVTEEEQSMYETFSVYEIEEELYYLKTTFGSDKEYENFLNTIKTRSNVDFGVNLSSEDEILTLSTCANNNKYRVVLHAKKILNTDLQNIPKE